MRKTFGSINASLSLPRSTIGLIERRIVMNRLEELRVYLRQQPTGSLSNTEEVERLLARCWISLDGGEESAMSGSKLIGRMENVSWNPPTLRFSIMRHRKTCMGSKYGNLQDWVVDVEQKHASLVYERKRLVHK